MGKINEPHRQSRLGKILPKVIYFASFFLILLHCQINLHVCQYILFSGIWSINSENIPTQII